METPRQIFDRLYDNDNKICTRKSLFEQFKEINRIWLQQKRQEHLDHTVQMHRTIRCFITELLEELK